MKHLFFAGVCCASLLAACSHDDGSNGAQDTGTNVIAGTLAVDIRQTVDVSLTPRGDGALDGALSFGDGDFQYFDAHTAFRGVVSVSTFPEAQTSMYAAIFAAPARTSSPCADQPLTLALSLVRRGTNARVGGGLTIYCGDGKTSGVPARILRLTGDLPLP